MDQTTMHKNKYICLRFEQEAECAKCLTQKFFKLLWNILLHYKDVYKRQVYDSQISQAKNFLLILKVLIILRNNFCLLQKKKGITQMCIRDRVLFSHLILCTLFIILCTNIVNYIKNQNYRFFKILYILCTQIILLQSQQ